MTHHATYQFPDDTPVDKAVNLLRKSGRRVEQVARSEFGSPELWEIARALKHEAQRILDMQPPATET